MMCAHSTPLAADVPAAQHALDNILDGGPSVLDAILYLIVTLLALAAIVLGFGPVFDWFTFYISAGGPNPYADSWYLLAKFFYARVVIVAIITIVWVWQSAIARVRYRREVR